MFAESPSRGTGGKFPKRSHHRRAPATPYARPPAADSRRWVPRVLDPALRFFSSVLRRAPQTIAPPPPVDPRETISQLIEPDNDEILADPPSFEEHKKGVKDETTKKGDCQLLNRLSFEEPCDIVKEETEKVDLGGDEVSKLESILKQKTFTRDEFDKLSELLRSRTIGLPPGNENAKAKPSSSKFVDQQSKIAKTSPTKQDGLQGSQLFESTLKHSAVLNVSEVEIASPTEIAKAYMGSRTSTPSLPSNFLYPPLKDIATSPSSSSYQTKSRDASVVSRHVIRFSKLLENGYQTPQSQCRASMYKLRKSQFKDRSVFKQATNSSTEEVFEPSGSELFSRDVSFPSSNLNLKRRSSMLDGGGGYDDPIRRTRQKSNFVTPMKLANLSSSARCLYSPSTSQHQLQGLTDSTRKPLLLHSAFTRSNDLVIEQAEARDDEPSCSRFSCVPQKSSLMAKKILQQLDQFVPSPNEKHSGQTSGGRVGSLSRLSLGGFQTGVLASSKDTSSFKTFELEDNEKSADVIGLYSKAPIPLPSVLDGIMTSKPAAVTNKFSGSEMLYGSNGMNETASPSFGADNIGSGSQQPVSNSAVVTLQSKLSVPKQVLESLLELHDDGGKDSSSILAEKGNLQDSEGEKIPVSSQMMQPATPIIFTSCFETSEKNNKHEDNDISSRVAYQISSEPCSISSASSQQDSLKEQYTDPVFIFGSNKTHRLTFSSRVSRCSDSSGLIFGTKSESNSQILGRKGDGDVGEEDLVFTFGAIPTAHARNGRTRPLVFFRSFSSESLKDSDLKPSKVPGSGEASYPVATSFGLSTQTGSIFGLSSAIPSTPISSISSQVRHPTQLTNIFGLVPASSTTANSISQQFGLQSSQQARKSVASVQTSSSQFSISSLPSFVSQPSYTLSMPFASVSSNEASTPTFVFPSMPGKEPFTAAQSGPSQTIANTIHPSEAAAPSALNFGSTVPPSGSSIFQFVSQQGQVLSPIPPSSNSDLTAGGSFSIGSHGDKSARRFFKAKRDSSRRK